MATPSSNPLAAYDDIVRYTLKPNLELLVGGGGGGGYWTAGTGANINDIYNTNSRNVGIGTATPETMLQVYSSTARFLTVGDSGGTSGPYGVSLVSNGVIDQGVTPHTLKKSSTYAEGAAAINMDHYGDIYMQGYNSGSSAISSTAWSPQFTLKASGRVGIGTTVPVYKLHVVESSANPAIYARTTGANYAIYGIVPATGSMIVRRSIDVDTCAINSGGGVPASSDMAAVYNLSLQTAACGLIFRNSIEPKGDPDENEYGGGVSRPYS